MSKIKNGGLDQYGAEPFEQQQFGTAGVEGVKPDQLAFTAHYNIAMHTYLVTETVVTREIRLSELILVF